MTDILSSPGAGAPPGALQVVAAFRPGAALWVLVATLCSVAVHAAGGFITLHVTGGDNDSLLRLVEVRDLLAGQGWYDPIQYRMGLPGGFAMHWSRLVDAPLAVLIMAGQALGLGQAAAETVALVFWPTLLFFAALFLLVRMARRLAGEAASLPALIVGGVALHAMGIFAPGAIDHHNVQLVLLLGALALLIGRSDATGAALAGACSALMLGVGMETAPYVALTGALVASFYWFEGRPAAAFARGYGLGFAAVAGAIFVAVVPPTRWSAEACDAFSAVQFAVAALGGLGLAGIAAAGRWQGSRTRRAAALLGLGVLVAGLVIAAFPQCLADPYAGLDARLKTYWLDAVLEAQPLWSVAVNDPRLLAGYYATPFVAMIVAVAAIARGTADRRALCVFVLLSASVAVSVWQVRGAMFSIPLAVLPLSAWIARWRDRAAQAGRPAVVAMMAVAWLASFSATWSAAGAGIGRLAGTADAAREGGAAPSAASSCQDADSFAALAALPPARVLATSNLGAAILRYTGHSALAGPYHRNTEGNLLALTAFLGPPAEAEGALRRNGVTLVAFCPGNSESDYLADAAPAGLIAALRDGRTPAFLIPVDAPADQSLHLYRLR